MLTRKIGQHLRPDFLKVLESTVEFHVSVRG